MQWLGKHGGIRCNGVKVKRMHTPWMEYFVWRHTWLWGAAYQCVTQAGGGKCFSTCDGTCYTG